MFRKSSKDLRLVGICCKICFHCFCIFVILGHSGWKFIIFEFENHAINYFPPLIELFQTRIVAVLFWKNHCFKWNLQRRTLQKSNWPTAVLKCYKLNPLRAYAWIQSHLQQEKPHNINWIEREREREMLPYLTNVRNYIPNNYTLVVMHTHAEKYLQRERERQREMENFPNALL